MPRQKVYRNEGDVKDTVKKILKRHGCWYFMPSMNGYGRASIPDFIVAVGPLFLAIETKFGNNKPTKNQAQEIKDIKEAGAIAIVINEKNLDKLERIIIWLKGRRLT